MYVTYGESKRIFRLLRFIVERQEQLIESLNERFGCLMSSVSDLQAEVSGLRDDVTALQDSVTQEIARVEKVIADLEAGGSADPAVAQAVVDLKDIRTNLKAADAQVDAERP